MALRRSDKKIPAFVPSDLDTPPKSPRENPSPRRSPRASETALAHPWNWAVTCAVAMGVIVVFAAAVVLTATMVAPHLNAAHTPAVRNIPSAPDPVAPVAPEVDLEVDIEQEEEEVHSHAKRWPSNCQTDTIVVGAGPSGLTSAYYLSKAKVRVTVYDARTDGGFGGRARSGFVGPNSDIEVPLGATYLFLEDNHAYRLAREVNAAPIFPAQLLPRVLGLNNLILHPFLFLHMWWLGFTYARARDDFWNAPGAAALDAKNTLQYLEGFQGQYGSHWNGSVNAVRDYLYLLGSHPTDLSKMSALYTSVFIYKQLRLFDNGGLYTYPPGILHWNHGPAEMWNAVAERARIKGTIFNMRTKVTAIDYSNSQCITVSSQSLDGGPVTTKTAARVILAMGVPAPKLINFTPPLAQGYRDVFDAIDGFGDPSEQCIFGWNERWYSTYGNTILPPPDDEPETGVWGQMYDITPDNSPRWYLRILAGAHRGVSSMTDAEFFESCKVFFRKYYGNVPQIENPDEMVRFTHRIEYPYIPAESYYWPAGNLSAYGDYMLKSVNNRIFFAGAERSANATKYQEGAVQRAEQVVADVLKSLNMIPNSKKWLNKIQCAVNALRTLQYLRLEVIQYLQQAQEYSCTVLNNAGFNCLPPYKYRVSSLTAIEQLVFASLNTALGVLNGLTSLLGLSCLLGLDLPNIY